MTRSGYYAWCHRKLSPWFKENEILSQEIQQIHQASRETYGSPRIHAALVDKGFQIGRQRVVRLMAKLGVGPVRSVNSRPRLILSMTCPLLRMFWLGTLQPQSLTRA